MKIIFAIVILFACTNNEPAHGVEEETPCHTPVKKVDLGGGKIRLIFNCDPSNHHDILPAKDGQDGQGCNVVERPGGAELKCGAKAVAIKHGKSGGAGRQGPIGPKGDPGDGTEKFVKVCRHDPVTHIDKTWSIKVSELISSSWGSDTRFDYAGGCRNEGQCSCDQCLTFDSNHEPLFYHGDLHLAPLSQH